MANLCPECGKGELTLRDVKPKVSAAGLLGAFLAVVGFISAFFNPVIGIGMIAVGIVIGIVGRGKRTEVICPLCGHRHKL
jgi:predicted RNA-binding Zn-ribbon protein involved in translation (DUF1610 family)